MSKDQSIHIKDAVYKLQLSLLDGIKHESQLFAAGSLMSRSDYEDVVTERTISNLCGYPLCNNSLSSDPLRKGRYHISLKEHKVYDQLEIRRFCSSSCLIKSRAFAGSLQEERCSILNTVELSEILDMFEDLSLDDSLEDLKEIGDLGLSRLKIQENAETKVGEVSLGKWMGPSNAIEGYVPKRDRKSKTSHAKYSKDDANDAKPRMGKDCPINEMGFTSTVITSNEYGISKISSGLSESNSTRLLEEQKGKGICKDWEQQAVVSESSSAPGTKSKESRVEVKVFGEDEHTLEEAYDGSIMNDVEAEKKSLFKKAGGSSEITLKPSLNSSGAKKLGRSVTWADERTDCVGSGNLYEVREMKNTIVGPQSFSAIDEDDVDSMTWLESAGACAIALSQAAEAVASGNSDVNDIVSEAGIIILPHPHNMDEGELVEDVEPEPAPLKWPVKPGIPHYDVFDPEDSWFDAPPEGFSLTLQLSSFATMWNALFGWITSSSLAYIYGKDESFHEDYLFVNGKEYPRKIILADGRSSEIKETLAGCLGRALPAVVADLGLPTSVSDIEKGLGCLVDTMCFTDALPALRMKQWQVVVLLFVDALSVCRIPVITPYMTNGRMLLYKVLKGGQMSMEEYEIMKDFLIPLGRAPHFAVQSGA